MQWVALILAAVGSAAPQLRDKCWWEWKVALIRRQQPGGRRTPVPEPPPESLLSCEGFSEI